MYLLTIPFADFYAKLFVFAELVADLREAILQIARHFDAIDPKKVRTLC